MEGVKFGEMILRVGMTVRAKQLAEDDGVAPKGVTPVIFKIIEGHSKYPVIALYHKPFRIEGYDWTDLDGDVESRRGYWIELADLFKYFDLPDAKVEIAKDVYIKNRNLKGMCGVVVASGEFLFLELEENVGGCSADGHGKAGHCVAVPHDAIKMAERFVDCSKIELF